MIDRLNFTQIHFRVIKVKCLYLFRERHGSVVVSTSAWHAGNQGSIPVPGMLYCRCKNMALHYRLCTSLCLSDETLKAVGPFYLVSMQGK